MIKTVTFNNVGEKSLNSDLAAIELPPEFITYGENFQVRISKLVELL